MGLFIWYLVIVVGIFSFPLPLLAVPSPDLVIGVGTLLVQWLVIGIAFILGVFGVMHRFIQQLYHRSKGKFFLAIIGGAGSVFCVVIVLVFGYQEYQSKRLVAQLQEQDSLFRQNLADEDKLAFSNNPITLVSEGTFVSKINSSTDQGAKIIEQYYEYIAQGKLKEAYALSHQKVTEAVFRQWYSKVSKVSIDKLTHISTGEYSLELTLCEESDKCSRYGVLITLSGQGENYTRIANSQVRSLQIDSEKGVRVIQDNLAISNAELEDLIKSGQIAHMSVLDARENIEYANGRFPNSLHIRIADLKAGKWIDLDPSKTIVVLCWSGIRGKEVAEFLRSKELNAQYVEDGAQGWVESGGLWNGEVSIKKTYTEQQYSRLLSCDEMKREIQRGVVLVDSREPGRFAQQHVAGSISIPMLYTPSSKVEETFSQVPQGSRVVTVCDGYVNCFDARVTGIELEKRGHEFLGRFTQLRCVE